MVKRWEQVPMTWRWLRGIVAVHALRHSVWGSLRIVFWAALLWVSWGDTAQTLLFLFLLAAEALMIADRCWWIARVRRQERSLGVSFEEDMAGRSHGKRYVHGKWFISAEPMLVFHRDYIKSVKLRTGWEKVDADPLGGTMVLEGLLTVDTADDRRMSFTLKKDHFSTAAALKRWVDTGCASRHGPSEKKAPEISG